ncbi:hypothetical protein VTN77DRAFT_369 [Rasamsonia byssochlamydoides]|uniref:uncharacterized protein n=1 Tax=Rasamsonia byssochlamydoides TaxID=89139 RepID=UPI00374282C7
MASPSNVLRLSWRFPGGPLAERSIEFGSCFPIWNHPASFDEKHSKQSFQDDELLRQPGLDAASSPATECAWLELDLEGLPPSHSRRWTGHVPCTERSNIRSGWRVESGLQNP